MASAGPRQALAGRSNPVAGARRRTVLESLSSAESTNFREPGIFARFRSPAANKAARDRCRDKPDKSPPTPAGSPSCYPKTANCGTAPAARHRLGSDATGGREKRNHHRHAQPDFCHRPQCEQNAARSRPPPSPSLRPVPRFLRRQPKHSQVRRCSNHRRRCTRIANRPGTRVC